MLDVVGVVWNFICARRGVVAANAAAMQLGHMCIICRGDGDGRSSFEATLFGVREEYFVRRWWCTGHLASSKLVFYCRPLAVKPAFQTFSKTTETWRTRHRGPPIECITSGLVLDASLFPHSQKSSTSGTLRVSASTQTYRLPATHASNEAKVALLALPRKPHPLARGNLSEQRRSHRQGKEGHHAASHKSVINDAQRARRAPSPSTASSSPKES